MVDAAHVSGCRSGAIDPRAISKILSRDGCISFPMERCFLHRPLQRNYRKEFLIHDKHGRATVVSYPKLFAAGNRK